MPVMKLDKVAVAFDGTPVLKEVNFQVHPGDVVAILGENGSGKSTLLRAATGLITPSAGQVQLFGVDTRQRSAVPWKRMGYVPQRVAPSASIPATAAEVVRTGLISRPWLRGKKSPKVLQALQAVGLGHRANDQVANFSGGQAQRVAIARALVRDPDLLILDEPTSGVDERRKEELAALFGDLSSRGRAIVIVLHDLGPFAPHINRSVTIENGVIAHECKVIDGIPYHLDEAEDEFHNISAHVSPLNIEDDSAFAPMDNPLGW